MQNQWRINCAARGEGTAGAGGGGRESSAIFGPPSVPCVLDGVILGTLGCGMGVGFWQ